MTVDEIIKLADGEIAVCNQWGKTNAASFIKRALMLVYKIEEA